MIQNNNSINANGSFNQRQLTKEVKRAIEIVLVANESQVKEILKILDSRVY